MSTGDRTIPQIFEALGPIRLVATWMGVKISTASEMKRRGKISGEYWPVLALNAAKAGHAWCTIEYLAKAHAQAKGMLPSEYTDPVSADARGREAVGTP